MRLGYVFPRFTAKQIPHTAVANSIFSGKSCRAYAKSITLSRFNDLLFGKFCVRMVRSAWLTLLCYFVCHIKRASTQEMMSRIATGRIIALMADNKAIWNWAICQFVSDAMSQKRLATATNMDSPVAKFIGTALPFPTIIRAKHAHLRPEPFRNRAKAGIVPVNELKWFALHMAASIFISCCYPGFLSTTAVAVAKGDFLREGVRGMIAHVDTFLSRFGHTAGRSQRRCGNFMRFAAPTISQVVANG